MHPEERADLIREGLLGCSQTQEPLKNQSDTVEGAGMEFRELPNLQNCDGKNCAGKPLSQSDEPFKDCYFATGCQGTEWNLDPW